MGWRRRVKRSARASRVCDHVLTPMFNQLARLGGLACDAIGAACAALGRALTTLGHAIGSVFDVLVTYVFAPLGRARRRLRRPRQRRSAVDTALAPVGAAIGGAAVAVGAVIGGAALAVGAALAGLAAFGERVPRSARRLLASPTPSAICSRRSRGGEADLV